MLAVKGWGEREFKGRSQGSLCVQEACLQILAGTTCFPQGCQLCPKTKNKY